MSMTLILWKAPVVDDADEAKALTADWYETGDDSAFEPSEDIVIVADALRQLYPIRPISGEEVVAAMSEEERGRYTEEGLAELREAGSYTQDEGGPWADLPFYESDRLLALDIRWSADNAVIDNIFRLAREHGLVLYDPQGPDVTLPTDQVDTGPTPLPTIWDWLKIVAITAFLVALTWAAWQIPIGWVRWPALIVAGFFAAAALFVVGSMIAGTLGIVDANAPPKPCHDDTPPL